MGVVFVGGVHAVGKSSTCQNAAALLDLRHYSASGLIRAERESAISASGKSVEDIPGNQDLLIRGVRRTLENGAHPIILDGHFTLISQSGSIETISTEVFEQLQILAFVVYRDNSKLIADRLTSRDGSALDADFIDRHQNLEIEHARSVAGDLNVPLSVLNAFDDQGLVKVVSQLIGK